MIPVTGHADGSIRFWDTTGTDMKHLYRLRTQKLFEKNREKSSTGDVELEDDPYSITNIAFSADTRALAVTGSTDQVMKVSQLIATMQMFCHNFYSQWIKLFVECFESFAVHENKTFT